MSPAAVAGGSCPTKRRKGTREKEGATWCNSKRREGGRRRVVVRWRWWRTDRADGEGGERVWKREVGGEERKRRAKAWKEEDKNEALALPVLPCVPRSARPPADAHFYLPN